jgi:DNA-binding MarR family transcriptional regulator
MCAVAVDRRSETGRLLLVDACAARLVEIAPLAVRFMRAQMRKRLPTLTMAQFRALAFLYRRRDCSVSVLADHLGVTLPTASALVARLVRRGLATRTTNMMNRRQAMLRLTHGGLARFEVAKSAARRQTARRLAGLSPLRLRALRDSLDALAGAFAGETEQAHQ